MKLPKEMRRIGFRAKVADHTFRIRLALGWARKPGLSRRQRERYAARAVDQLAALVELLHTRPGGRYTG